MDSESDDNARADGQRVGADLLAEARGTFFLLSFSFRRVAAAMELALNFSS